jgi:3-hydroxyacyl-CoA dehydrogenase/enoyl-CoA hydratase/3-hydroxybutyryl-CoA epimerase
MSELRNDIVAGTFDDATGIATLSLEMDGPVNKINAAFVDGLVASLDWAYALDGLKGIILTSGRKDFCAGADLDMVYTERDPARILEGSRAFHQLHRRLETSGVTVVAALTGTALGGGMELALATHHRVALDSPKVQFGLPETMLGLIPGGGGTQRLPRLIGLQAGLEHVVQGKVLRAPKAFKAGLVDALAPTREAVLAQARDWILANPGAKQPWDKRGFTYPGGIQPGSTEFRNLFLAGAAMLYKKTAGTMPGPQAAMSAIHEGCRLDFERSLEVEARFFAGLVVSDQAKDMIRTLFFHKTAAEKQQGLPRVEDHGFKRVAILGAGMMGSGLAFVCANRGLNVVLRDIDAAAVERGMAHIRKQLDKRRHLDAAAREAILARITATVDLEPIRGCDLVIEAVIENIDIKHSVTREVEPLLADGAIYASNTSAIPITDLAEASAAPDRFIGLHFFSPVEKMPLLEVIRGKETSDETLARSLALARLINKTVIVVNDGYGFYTSRVFSSYIVEGAQLAAEGHEPNTIEYAAKQAGMVVAPLQVFDEVSLGLARHAMKQAVAYKGEATTKLAGVQLVFALVDEHNRLGKAHGAGFYDYVDGRRRGIWPGLAEIVGTPEEALDMHGLARRLLLAQCAEVVRCLDEGILRTHRDAEVGAIFGIGFGPNMGGPLAWMDRQGLPQLVAELDGLANTHGERFRPAAILRSMAEKGERFFPEG